MIRRLALPAGLVWLSGCGLALGPPQRADLAAKRQDPNAFAICATGPVGGPVSEWCRYRCDFDRDGDVDLFDWSRGILE